MLSKSEDIINEILEKYHSWNIFFVATNIFNNKIKNDDDGGKAFLENDGIHICTKKFKEDILASKFSDKINISLFEFEIGLDYPTDNLDKAIGIPKISYAEKDIQSNNYKITEATVLPTYLKRFNPLDDKSYTQYFNYAKNYSPGSKNLVIYLSHSFGAGFLNVTSKKIVDNKEIVEYNYFSTPELNKAIKNSFPQKLDCLLALNCSIQSVETNAILRDSVKLLIASQQELYVETIAFQQLFSDLSRYSINDKLYTNEGFSDEHLFTKFILNCHDNYLNDKIKNSDFDIKPFNLVLTKPEQAKYFMSNLNYFGFILQKINGTDDLNFIRYTKSYCEDPSSTDLTNVVDAKQFFDKLLEYFTSNENTIKEILLKNIIDNLNDIIVFKLITGNSTENESVYGDNLQMYIPNGLGLFVRKITSPNSTEMINIYNVAFDSVLSLGSTWIGVIKDTQSTKDKLIKYLNDYKIDIF